MRVTMTAVVSAGETPTLTSVVAPDENKDGTNVISAPGSALALEIKGTIPSNNKALSETANDFFIKLL